MKKVYLFILTILSITVVQAQDQCKPVGWATQNGGVTGGGSASPTIVTTYTALKTALTTASVKVVHVSGTITFPTAGRITVQDMSGKTIIGLPGSRMISVDRTSGGSGILYIKRCTNFIMRNLTFEGPGAYDTDGNDNLTLEQCTNFWVDHCDFQDGMDGNFDIKTASDFITVTWCKFTYLKAPIAGGSGGSNDHRYTNLIGSSDGATGDDGKLRITFQYCWWGQGCVERMPRVRFGKVHLANNLYNSTVSNNVIRAGYKADLLIESNVFIGVNKPIDLFENDFTAVTARNNIFTNTSGGTTGSGTSFTPPYALTISAASGVQSLVTNTTCGSGATLDSPTQCGCGTVPTDPNPTATISAPSTACVNTAITITATANANGGTLSKVDFYNGTTLIGSDNSSPYSISYTPITTGTLSLTATATNTSNTTGSSTNISVTVSAPPIATITSSTTNLCTAGPIVLSASAGSSYKWFSGATQVGTATTFTASTPGDYTVEVTNAGGCKALSAVRTLTGTPQATPTITTPSISICAGGSVVLTSSSGTSYKWFNGTTQVGTAVSYTANMPGAYSVEVTNGSGCKATSAVTQISVATTPVATITASKTSFCTGSSVILSASAGASFKWFNGNTLVGTAPTYSAAAAGSYTVEITHAGNCKATSVASIISENTNPSAIITSTTTAFCPGQSILLTASAGNSYKWFLGTSQIGTNATFNAIAPGEYTVEVSNTNGCKQLSPIKTITLNSVPTATISTSKTTICAGSSTVLTANTGNTYKWFNGSALVGTDINYTAAIPGDYSVEVSYTSGCKSTSAITPIIQSSVPIATISTSSTSICTGSSTVLTASPGNSYKWYNGTTQVGTASTYTAMMSGAYTVEVTNASDCKATSPITQVAMVTSPIATITTTSNSICPGGSVVLTANTGTSYKWFKGTTQVGTASTYTATDAGTYYVEVSNTGDCKAMSSGTTISAGVNPNSTITSPEKTVCDGGSIVLTASTGVSYKWFNGTTEVGNAPTYTATASGSYTVEVTNASHCIMLSAPTTINISTSPLATITGSSTICSGVAITLTSSAGNSYKWYNGSTQVGTGYNYTTAVIGDYTVEVTNAAGCKATSAVKTITTSQPTIWYADLDGDGFGDPKVSLTVCWQPTSYISIAGDACPSDGNKTEPGICGCGIVENTCTPTGTVNGTTSTITVTPQPFEESTQVSLVNYGVIKSVMIISTSGAIVETINNVNESTILIGESLASGLYSVVIQSDKGIYTTKIIKK